MGQNDMDLLELTKEIEKAVQENRVEKNYKYFASCFKEADLSSYTLNLLIKKFTEAQKNEKDETIDYSFFEQREKRKEEEIETEYKNEEQKNKDKKEKRAVHGVILHVAC